MYICCYKKIKQLKMNLSEVKLIVTDMDGTLLNSKHEVSPLFFKQFEQLKANNIKFVAASGRQYHSILDKLKSIKEHITIVAENGAYVVKNGKELFVNAIPKNDITGLLLLCKQIKNTHIVLCGKKKAYFLKNLENFENTVAEYYTEYEILENFDSLPNDDFLKIALCHYDGSETNIYPYLKEIEADWQLKVSGKLWLDIALKENHKGNAIENIQNEYGISPEQTMAFGDYHNDIEMLKKANYSFAMQNAHPDVKEIAHYETYSNNNLGVENVLEKLLKTLND